MIDDDLSELLISAAKEGTSGGMLAQRVCTKVVGVCKKGKTPLWPEGKVRRNEEFTPKTKKDQETDQLMESLKNMPGMGGQSLSMMYRPRPLDACASRSVPSASAVSCAIDDCVLLRTTCTVSTPDCACHQERVGLRPRGL